MKNLFKKLSTLFITLVLVMNMNAAFAQSQGLLKDKLTNIFEKYSEETSLVPFADTTSKFVIEDGSYFSITTVIFAFSGLLKYVAYAIMLILGAVSIFRLVTAGSGGSEEIYGNIKNYLLQIGIAVFVIFSSEFIFNKVFIGKALESTGAAKETALKVSGEILGIVGMIQSIIIAFSILMIIWAGIKMVSNMGNEEAVSGAKSQILWGSAGLLVVMMGGTLVNDILFVDSETFDPLAGQRLILSIANFISGIVATASLISFFYAGYQYVVGGFSEVNQEKIKSAIFGGIIGILLSLAGFAIANTVINLDSPTDDFFEN